MSQRKPATVTGDGLSTFLKCPHCDDTYLHQRNVTVFQRAEDDDWTTVIAQDGHDAVVTKFPSSETPNPSYRRHGITIEFECEHCSWEWAESDERDVNGCRINLVVRKNKLPLRLAIYQHKGFTIMEWIE